MREAAARKLVYARSQGRCEICAAREGTNFHHRQSHGRIWSPENGLHLCGSGTTGCHGWVTEHPSISRELGWMVSNFQPPTAPGETPALVRGRWCVLLHDGGLFFSAAPVLTQVPPMVPLRFRPRPTVR